MKRKSLVRTQICLLTAFVQLVIVLLPTMDARTQAPKAQVVPQPPIQKLRAPDRARWEIAIQPKRATSSEESAEPQGQRPANPKVLAETVEKDGSFYHFLQRFENGTSVDFYALPRLQFVYDRTSGRVSRRLANESGSIDLAESDFPELYWVIGQPARLEQINETEYLIVELESSAMPRTLREESNLKALRALGISLGEAGALDTALGDAGRPDGVFRLLLDPKTRLPVRLETPDEIRTYRFTPSAGLKGKLPGPVAEAVRLHQDAIRPPSAP